MLRHPRLLWPTLGLLIGTPWAARAQGDGFDLQLRVTGQKTYVAPSDVTAIAVSFGGRLAAGTKDGKIVLWNQEGSDPPKVIQAAAKPINALRFSPDASLLASAADDGQAALWKSDTLARADHFQQDGGSKALTLAFSPDGQSVAVGYDKGQVRVWGVAGGPPARVISHHKGKILAVSFKPRDNNTVVIIGEDKVMSTWDLSSGEQSGGDVNLLSEDERKGAKPQYFSAAVADDGSRFAIPAMRVNIIGNYSGIVDQHWIKLVRPTGQYSYIDLGFLEIGSNKNPAIALSPDGRLLAMSGESEKRENRMYVRNVPKGSPVGSITLPSRIRYFAIGPSANGYQVTAADGKEVDTFPVDFANSGEPTEALAVTVTAAANDSSLGDAVADTVQDEVVNSGTYQVVTRSNLKEVLQEQQLSDAGLVDKGSRVKVGHLVGAKKFLRVSLTHLDAATYHAGLELEDVQSGQVVASKSGDAATERDVLSLARALTGQILHAAEADERTTEPQVASGRVR